MTMQPYDLLIAGGGPAGSTIAALTKKYTPHLRVLLLEKAHFPRHHVGESLLAGASPVLREMGAYEKIDRYGFTEKLGATYIWGQERTPWGFDFNEVIAKAAASGQPLPATYAKAWQVRRAEYDQILLDHAAEMGATVRQGAQVRRPLVDEASGRVIGVEYVDERGTHQVESRLFVDCTGQDALLGRAFGLREHDPLLNNLALYGYWQGAVWNHDLQGYPHLTRILIATSPRGWFWTIPVAQETMSVGFVTHRSTLQESNQRPEELYRAEIAGCPELAALLAKADLVRLVPDQAHDLLAVRDWSYRSRRMAGPGWALCGDAAGFVDPILSSGAMLAHELGQKAAYTINSSFRASSDDEIERYWAFYTDTYHTYLSAYRDMAAFWYSNNFSLESWWWQAQRTAMQRAPASPANKGASPSDRDAFIRLSAGYANRAESLSLFGSYPLHEAMKLVDGLFGVANSAETTAKLQRRYAHRRLRLHPRAQLTDGYYYFQGLIRNTRRVIGPHGDHLDLHPGEEVLVQQINGRHTLAELDQFAAQLRQLQQRLPVRDGTALVVQLDAIGALR